MQNNANLHAMQMILKLAMDTNLLMMVSLVWFVLMLEKRSLIRVFLAFQEIHSIAKGNVEQVLPVNILNFDQRFL